MNKTISQKIIDLAKNYKELSQKHFGWKTTYLRDGYIVDDSHPTDTEGYRFYFAKDDDHCSIQMNGIDVSLFSSPTIELRAFILDDLDKYYQEELVIFGRVQKNMEDQAVHEEQDEKKQRIEALKLQIEELQK